MGEGRVIKVSLASILATYCNHMCSLHNHYIPHAYLRTPPHSPHLHTLPPPHPHLHPPTSIPSHCYHSPDVTVEFIQSSYTANEGDGVVLLEISKNGLSQQDVVVDVVLQDLTARGGLASLLPSFLSFFLLSILSLFTILSSALLPHIISFSSFHSLFSFISSLSPLSLHHPSFLSVHSLSSPSVPFHLCPPLVFVHLFRGPSVPSLPRWVGLWSISLV